MARVCLSLGPEDDTIMTLHEFQQDILQGIPRELPPPQAYDPQVSHAPIRNIQDLTADDRKLALRNALRYFPTSQHAVLAPEFAEELNRYGRIYM